MAALQLPVVPPFSVGDKTNLSQRWKKWVKSFNYYLVATGITETKRQRALLLHLAGREVQEVFETLADTGEDFATALQKLDEYFEPLKNTSFERHVFRQASQGAEESIDEFATRLRQLAASCEFHNAEEMIRDQIVDKCMSTKLRRRLLQETSLTLARTLTIGRSLEFSSRQATKMETGHASGSTVNFVKRKNVKPFTKDKQNRDSDQRGNESCYCCGKSDHRAKSAVCPALNKTCNKCKKTGHFARVCRSSVKTDSQGINSVEVCTDSSEDEYVFVLKKPHSDQLVDVQISGIRVKMIIDSGASVNVIDGNMFQRMSARGVTAVRSDIQLFAYGSNIPLKVQGSFHAKICYNGRETTAKFVVVQDMNAGSLLGRQTATALGLLRVGPELNHISHQETTVETLKKYEGVFEGVGKLENFSLNLHIDASVKPVAQPLRRVPFQIREKVAKKIQELQQMDIIERVAGPTPWVSPLVAVPKADGEVRVCVDMRQANQAVVRERHPIPTVEETLQELQGAAVFTKLDLKWGYHQIELDPGSREITTFVTHQGLWRYKRLMFGISSAPEIYQHVIQQTFQGCPGMRNISDDIVVYGKTVAEHDHNLDQVLQRVKEKGLTLNKQKCVFRVPELNFFGFKVSAAGVSPDDRKVAAIRDARRPENPNEVRSFLGLVNYCARFFPNLATEAEPIRKLTRQDTEWEWSELQEQAFTKLKTTLTSDCVMAHYGSSLPTQLRVDASPVGLGAILTQTGPDGSSKPVAYASRTLSDVERRYSQTEREALAVVWGCERFHLYLFGLEFSLYTDHKPLEVIYGYKAKPPARIERWSLRLQPYRFKIIYEPGPKNPADVLSRLPLQGQVRRERSVAEEYVNFVVTHAAPVAIPLDEIRKAMEIDPILQQVKKCVQSNRWGKQQELQAYYNIRQELTVVNDLLLRERRLVIPQSLQSRTLKLAHEGHQGVVKTKCLLREKVWWPGIDKQVETLIKHCIPCQAQAPATHPEPVNVSLMPDKPWGVVYADLYGPLPTGESVLVMIDGFSRWPEVEVLKHSTTTETLIARYDKVFAAHGYPGELTTDNGPQFASEAMEKYLKEKGIKHRKVSPYWPRANGEVERFNRTLGKMIKAFATEGKDWRKELPQALLHYRATPHTTTGVSPAKLLLGREIKTKLPEISEKATSPEIDKARKRDADQKQRFKKTADKNTKAVPSQVVVGDRVLLRQQIRNKLTTRYDPRPYVVKERIGPSLILQRGQEPKIMRNVSFVHPIPKDTAEVEDDDDDEDMILRPTPDTIPVQTENVVREHSGPAGRPRRDRVIPQHLKDYVLDSSKS